MLGSEWLYVNKEVASYPIEKLKPIADAILTDPLWRTLVDENIYYPKLVSIKESQFRVTVLPADGPELEVYLSLIPALISDVKLRLEDLRADSIPVEAILSTLEKRVGRVINGA